MKDLKDNESFNLKTDEEATGLSGRLRRSAREMAEEAQELAGTVTEKGRQVASQQAYRGKEQLARTLESLGDVAKDAAERLRLEGNSGLGDFVDRAARSLDYYGDVVRQQNLRDIVPRVESFARRRPALVMGGFFLLGFAMARFLKSSSQDEGSWSGGMRSNVMARSPIYAAEARI